MSFIISSKQKLVCALLLVASCSSCSLFPGFDYSTLFNNSSVQKGAAVVVGASVLYLGYKNYCLKSENSDLKQEVKQLESKNTKLENRIDGIVDALFQNGVANKNDSLESAVLKSINKINGKKNKVLEVGIGQFELVKATEKKN